MRILYENLSREEADTYGLVLSSSGLTDFQVKREQAGWSIRAAEPMYEIARQSIETYRMENPGTAPRVEPEPPVHEKTTTAVWVSLILISAFLATGSGEAFHRMAGLCGASAREIMNGELYRSATALMLHATPAHLAGNVAGIALFGTAVCAITGPGAGWLIILLTGIIGNLANAAFFRSGHLSVGASTAVFGAVGFLSAWQVHRKLRIPGKRIKAWLPLAAGLALLGFLGSGPHTDLTAHLFGFAAGLFIGLIYARVTKHPLSSRYQVLCMAVAVCLLSGSWLRAYFGP